MAVAAILAAVSTQAQTKRSDVEKAFKTMHDTWESQGAGDKIGLEWFQWLQCHCPFDQLIWEQRLTWIDSHPYLRCWIHISCRRKLDKNRQQVLVLKK